MKQTITLNKRWTKRKIFTRFKKYNNGRRAWNADLEICQYENDDGNRCAIGAFMPNDPILLSSINGIRFLIVSDNKLLKFMSTNDIIFLERLQNAHDETPQKRSTYKSVLEFLDKFKFKQSK